MLEPEVERTPPVRRPARREARGLGAEVVAMVVGLDFGSMEWKGGCGKGMEGATRWFKTEKGEYSWNGESQKERRWPKGYEEKTP